MRELTQSECIDISGGGFIADIAGAVGDFIGDSLYAFLPEMTVKIPILGALDIKAYFPDLGQQLGKSVGQYVGMGIESVISHIPVFGGVLNKLMGN